MTGGAGPALIAAAGATGFGRRVLCQAGGPLASFIEAVCVCPAGSGH